MIFSVSFPSKLIPFSKVSNILAFFIKPLGYHAKDWHWLVEKFEKWILLWSNKLLSIGGRLVRIQVVLSIIHVYRFSLVPLPKSILNKLRKLIFSFLWGTKGESKWFHLMDQKSLSKPLNHGGWGIKNLDWFSMSLRLKSFWMVLNGKGLWSQVITTKYLKSTTLESWLIAKCFAINGPSIMWNGFLHTLMWLGRSLSWQVGNGRNIQVGIDPIIGTRLSPFLPHDLIIFL